MTRSSKQAGNIGPNTPGSKTTAAQKMMMDTISRASTVVEFIAIPMFFVSAYLESTLGMISAGLMILILMIDYAIKMHRDWKKDREQFRKCMAFASAIFIVGALAGYIILMFMQV